MNVEYKNLKDIIKHNLKITNAVEIIMNYGKKNYHVYLKIGNINIIDELNDQNEFNESNESNESENCSGINWFHNIYFGQIDTKQILYDIIETIYTYHTCFIKLCVQNISNMYDNHQLKINILLYAPYLLDINKIKNKIKIDRRLM
jgi:hypothetical protein